MDFSAEDLKEFAAEATDLMAAAEEALLAIDSGDANTAYSVNYDVIFRAFHNLKGSAGMMELVELQAHTHELETILVGFKEAQTLPKEYISFFLRGLDGAREILSGNKINFDYTVTETAVAMQAVIENFTIDSAAAEFFAECGEIVERVSSGLQKLEAMTYTKDTIDSLYRDFHSLKGTAYLFSFVTLGDLSHVLESALEELRTGVVTPTPELLNGYFLGLKAIEQELKALKGEATDEPVLIDLPTLKAALRANSTGTIAVQAAPVPAQTAPQLSVSIPKPAAAPAPAPAPLPTAAEAEEHHFVQLAELAQASLPVHKEKEVVEAENTSIRVSVSLLDNLMTLMGEMVLVRNQVLQFSNRSEDQEFTNLSKRLNVVTNEIQDEMMKTRMQPIGNILSKFNRVVRDLSQTLHKSISLNLSGAETELDKTLLEAVKDPLTHIVRNSCDHGIETAEIRRAAGKSENGTISIKSFHEGGQVVIEIRDDGKGLSKSVLLKKGIEKGLITEAQAKAMGEKEIYNLIFAPGFSTAQKVTNVSGRGVGMDVVRTNIEKIGGTVDLMSVEGQGTTIRIKIPLTLAIIPALIIRSAEQIFAIPQVKLIELVRVDQSTEGSRIEELHGVPVFRLRGSILPLVDLNKLLGLSTSFSVDSERITNIAVLSAEQGSFGLIVDEVHDTADIVVKPLNRLLKSLLVYSGATVLGDGSVALILDVLGLSKVAQLGREENLDQNHAAAEIQQKKLLSEKQDFIVVKTHSHTKHAMVLGYVHRLEEFVRSDIEYSGTQRVIRYRNAVLPLINMNQELGYAQTTETRDTFPVIVVERAGKFFGIEVDEILDTLSSTQVVDRSLTSHPCIFGNLDTGEELVVIVDPFEVISHAFPEFRKTPVFEQKEVIPKTNLKILLAEDTVFFRKAVASVLEGAGHQVVAVCDGQDALETLQQDLGTFDLIVSDIEMPRMNGFALARAVRKNSVHSKIPMMAVSSRADTKYIDEGKTAGFDLYLEKLKPEILLAAVNQLTGTVRKVA